MNTELQSHLPAHAALESQRFGMNVFRGTLDSVDVKAIRRFTLDQGADLLILRFLGDSQEAAKQLDRLGFPYYHADVLVYYEVELASLVVHPLRNQDLVFQRCGPEHAPILAALVRDIFTDYRNHYTANPLLDSNKIAEGFQEWATGYVREDDSNRSAWIVRRGETWVGFATCSESMKECEGVLYGVHPDHAGGGVYSDLIRFTLDHFQRKGCLRMKVSTQVHNLAVQRVWNREGFSISSVYNTWHVNPMLTYTVRPIINHLFRIRVEDIDSLGSISGDFNPLHFDDEFAEKLGFSGRIAHGLFANGLISKVLGMEFPGPGTLFQGYKYIFMRPLYPDHDYLLSIRTLQVLPDGHWKCLARINNDQDQPMLLAYLDLLVKF